MELNHYIGIDVSKATLDFCVRDQHAVVLNTTCNNDKKSIKSLIKKLRKLPDFTITGVVFCMEYTGIYNNHLLDCLLAVKAKIWLESAMRIKHSQGMLRGKNDKVDAERIALYAYTYRNQIKLWEPPRKEVIELKNLITLRDRLVNSMKQLKTPLKEHSEFFSASVTKIEKKVFKGTLAAIEKDLQSVEKMINDLIDKDPHLKELHKLITSVDGVGTITAINILVSTNEFKSISDPQKFACYSGVAPFEHQSGSSIKGKARVSHLANKKIKTLLHLAAMAALNVKGELREYYQRKVEEGKNKMSTINAIRNKIIRRIFAVVKRGWAYEKNYQLSLV